MSSRNKAAATESPLASKWCSCTHVPKASEPEKQKALWYDESVFKEQVID